MVTIEQVKEHFKNAKEVRCVNSEDIGFVEIEKIKLNDNENGYIQNPFDKNWLVLFLEEKGYAEIISYKEEIKDTIVESVINQFKDRSKVGIEKYGTTLDRKDLTTLEWIEHAKQEAMDFILYLEKLKREYDN
jgi:hypothetical protein